MLGKMQTDHLAPTTRVGVWRRDLTTGRFTLSHGMYHLLGKEPGDETVTQSWVRQQIVPEDRDHLDTLIASAIRARSDFHYQTRFTFPDAPTKVIETHGEVELGPDGRVTTITGVCQDVTERASAEASHRQAEEMYRLIADHASDVIILYDQNGHILYCSNALERLLKRSPTEIDGTRFLDLVHPDDLPEATKISVAPRPGETLTATYRARHGDGHYLWIEATSRAIYDDVGFLQNIISVSRDVTERRRREFETAAARDRAEAANFAKSSFLANMSHELRTPLNAIIGFADIMQQQMFGPLGAPRYEEYAALIHESGGLLLDLISDVLDMAKIEAGKLTLNVEQVDLRSVVTDCLRLLSDRAAAGSVSLVADLADGDLSLEADRRALKQILLNLLSNAIKFTLAGGTVTIRVERRGSNLHITVIDDGIGISAEDLPRLGQPFEQVTTDPTLSKGGTGLGLALVRALTRKHGGDMQIESEEGAGTTVTIELPTSQDDARAAA